MASRLWHYYQYLTATDIVGVRGNNHMLTYAQKVGESKNTYQKHCQAQSRSEQQPSPWEPHEGRRTVQEQA